MLESCDPVPKGAMQSAVEVTSADPVSVHNMLGVTPFSKAKGACVPKAMIEMNWQIAQLPCALWPLSFNFLQPRPHS